MSKSFSVINLLLLENTPAEAFRDYININKPGYVGEFLFPAVFRDYIALTVYPKVKAEKLIEIFSSNHKVPTS
ncbi:hypothetical protein Q3407_08955 [Pseudomonas fulva]|nr:hypothetical protein Q3407_08955 [Pseudomonas fulva]